MAAPDCFATLRSGQHSLSDWRPRSEALSQGLRLAKAGGTAPTDRVFPGTTGSQPQAAGSVFPCAPFERGLQFPGQFLHLVRHGLFLDVLEQGSHLLLERWGVFALCAGLVHSLRSFCSASFA